MAYFRIVSLSLLIASVFLTVNSASGEELIAAKKSVDIAQKNANKKSTAISANRDADAQTIRLQATEYAKAFGNGDMEALASMWASDATFTDQFGSVASGRDQILSKMNSFFKANGKQPLELKIDLLEFPAENLAIEHGVSHVGATNNAQSFSTYTAVHVKRDGKWQMVNVSETPSIAAADAQKTTIADLAWLVGNWKVEGPKGSLQIKADWVAGKNMIRCDFDATTKEGDRSLQTQFFFLDPISRRIRSWQYDFDGGYGDSKWFNSGNDWSAVGRSVQADGSIGSARYLIKKLDDNTFSWQSTSRRLLGKRLPDSSVLTAKRIGS